ncbi:hypothetical protein EPI10_032736 [Gossypium australe]|uniref:Uncharacterized protein n=1 Tax=Gossypium australe TaxID=47621 RepID=A0A5B6X5C6_9ROSI|nr:hypothetical protein EPI10_032736 [Gossypium australe]
MKIQSLLRWVSLIFLISQGRSHSTQKHPILDDNLTIESFINKTLQWRKNTLHLLKLQGNRLELSTSTVVAAVLSFVAASISSAGGHWWGRVVYSHSHPRGLFRPQNCL